MSVYQALRARYLLWAVVFCFILGLLWALFGSTAIGNPQANMPPMPVQVQIIEPKNIALWQSVKGQIKAKDELVIQAQVSGTLEKVAFTSGQSVKAGQLLYQLDAAPFRLAVDQARANWMAADGQYQAISAKMQRSKPLIEAGSLSPQEIDELKSQVQVAEGQKLSAKAQLDHAQWQLNQTQIKAPFDGKMGIERLSVGTYVSHGAGGTVLGYLYDAETEVVFELTESQWANLDSSGEIRVLLPSSVANQSSKIKGKIVAQDARVNPARGTLRVKARLVDVPKNLALVSGQYVSLEIRQPEQKAALVIPAASILTDQDKHYVYIVVKNKIEQRFIQLGPFYDQDRLVQSGLKAGDALLISSIQKVQPQMPVQVISASEKTPSNKR